MGELRIRSIRKKVQKVVSKTGVQINFIRPHMGLGRQDACRGGRNKDYRTRQVDDDHRQRRPAPPGRGATRGRCHGGLTSLNGFRNSSGSDAGARSPSHAKHRQESTSGARRLRSGHQAVTATCRWGRSVSEQEAGSAGVERIADVADNRPGSNNSKEPTGMLWF